MVGCTRENVYEFTRWECGPHILLNLGHDVVRSKAGFQHQNENLRRRIDQALRIALREMRLGCSGRKIHFVSRAKALDSSLAFSAQREAVPWYESLFAPSSSHCEIERYSL